MIIDFHTHAFPEKIAARTLDVLIKNSEKVSGSAMTAHTDGTAEGLRGIKRRAGVDLAVILPIVTSPHQTETVNRVADQINRENNRLYSFCSCHPDDPAASEHIDRYAEAGFKGVKLHPEFQGFFADDGRALEIYRRAAKYGMTVVLHTGRDVGYPPPVHATPDMLLRVIDRVPDLKLVAAHFGGWQMWDEVAKKLVGTPIYLDTAYIADFIDPDLAREIIRAHGAEKILFGSDCPWEDPAHTLEFLRSLELDREEYVKICGENAAGLLGIEK